MLLKNAKIVLENKIIENGWIEIKDSKIFKINENSTNRDGIDLNGNWLLPGFIDCHVHGGYGVDFETGDKDRFATFAKNVVKEGVTSYIQSSVTNSDEKNLKILQEFQEFQNSQNLFGAKCLGVHLEGPFISNEKKGAHQTSLLKTPSITNLENIIKNNKNLIKIITFAPELQNGDFTKYLIKNNIIPSAGHSNIEFDQFKKDYQLGIKHITHLYNGMSGVNHQNPGLTAAALYYDDILCELITDGIHINQDILKLTYKIKGSKGICIITDAMNAKGLADGEYNLGDLEVVKTGIKVCLKNTPTLAGSASTYDHNIRVMLNLIKDMSMCDLINMSSINIAKQLNIFNETGSITVGKKADLVVLDKNFYVLKTIVEGKVYYNK